MNSSISGMNHSTRYEAELNVITPPMSPADEIALLQTQIDVQQEWAAIHTTCGDQNAADNCTALADKFQVRIDALKEALRPDNATLQARADGLIAQLNDSWHLQPWEIAEIDAELAEIEIALQRDGEAVSDYGDARREAKFGVGL